MKYRIMDLKNEKTNTNEQDLLRSSSAVSLNVNSPTASSNDTRMEESATVFVSKNANLRFFTVFQTFFLSVFVFLELGFTLIFLSHAQV